MTERVMLTVTGEQTGADGQREKNTTVCSALYTRQGGVHKLFFTDTDPENGEGTSSEIRFSDRAFIISRKGQVETNMRLVAGRVTAGQYETPYGVLDMKLDTKQITLLESDDVIEAEVVYELQLGGAETVLSRVTVAVKPLE